MRTVDILCTKAMETQLKSLRSRFTAAGIIVRNTQSIDTANMAEEILNKHGASGFDIFIVYSDQQNSVEKNIRDAMEQSCFDRYHGAETHLRANQSPFSQCFVGQSDTALYIAIPSADGFTQNLMSLLKEDNAPLEFVQPSTIDMQIPPIEDDFEDDRSTLIEKIRLDSPIITFDQQSDKALNGWQDVIKAMGGVISNDAWAKIPTELLNIAPAKDVLETAGNRKTIQFSTTGKEYALFGFPSLEHPNCKALLIGPGEPFAEIIAIHRYPKHIGLLSESGSGWLPKPSSSLKELGRTMFETENPPEGQPFAIESNAIYFIRNNKVFLWNGKKETQWGTAKQAIASLMLQWSQR